jgi:hypothetical protein
MGRHLSITPVALPVDMAQCQGGEPLFYVCSPDQNRDRSSRYEKNSSVISCQTKMRLPKTQITLLRQRLCQ